MKNNLLDIKSLVQKETLEVISKLLVEKNLEKDRQKDLMDKIKFYDLEHEKSHKNNPEEKKEEDEEKLDKDKEISKNLDKSFDKSLSNKKDSKEKDSEKAAHPGTKESPKLKTPDTKTISNPTFEEIVNKLNILRGGKSLKNKEVQDSLRKYYSGLNGTEKSTLLVLLTAISQILAGVETGETALDLHDAGIDIENKNVKGIQKDQIKTPEKSKPAEIEKKTSIQTKEKEQPVIKIGENQDKTKLYKIFESYKRND